MGEASARYAGNLKKNQGNRSREAIQTDRDTERERQKRRQTDRVGWGGERREGQREEGGET